MATTSGSRARRKPRQHPEPKPRPEVVGEAGEAPATAGAVEDSGYRWSRRSERNLLECDRRIQRVMTEALRTSPVDMTVICGHRSREAQERAYREGRSQLRYPQSKHNAFPSHAVDVVPYPVDWNDLDRFVELARHILATADRLGVEMRWGGDWDRDGDWREHSFFDGPHFELV